MNRSYLKIAVVVSLLALFGFVQPAAACMGPPRTPPTVIIIVQSPTQFWIVFRNYVTFGASVGQFCACGLNQVSGITGFQAAMVVDPATNKPVEGWGFAANDNVGKQFDAAAPVIGTLKLTRGGQVVPSASQPPFGGFLSPISATVPAGRTVDLWICVTVLPGTTSSQIAKALTAQGLIGTSAASSDGTLQSGHTQIVRPGTIMQSSTQPGSTTVIPNFLRED
jgi:hypothetical protein